jgi:CRP-like cAMP-binding protein
LSPQKEPRAASVFGVPFHGGWERADTADWARVLGSLPLFARLGQRQLRKLAGLAQFKHFSDGDFVVRVEEPGDAFYVIVGGKAKVVGKRSRLLGIGDYFGEMALLDGEPRSATIVAANELQTMRLPRRAFLQLLEREPKIALSLLAELSSRVRRLEQSTKI